MAAASGEFLAAAMPRCLHTDKGDEQYDPNRIELAEGNLDTQRTGTEQQPEESERDRVRSHEPPAPMRTPNLRVT